MRYMIFLLALCATLRSGAQNIDTVVVRNLTLQAQDWAWLVAGAPIYADSTSATNFRRIRDRVRADNPPSWTTNVTVDSLAGKVVLYFYSKVKYANAGEIVSRYTAITSAINAKTNLSGWLSSFDAGMTGAYSDQRNLGRIIIMDN